jgi:tRNA (guanine37-N1)-methyltransferase
MTFDIITLFPEYFRLSLAQSLLGKASDKGLVTINIIDLRDYATDKHHTVDDTPFGGGGGMVMKVEPLDRCLQARGIARKYAENKPAKQHLILTSAAGAKFDQRMAISYSLSDRITIICGHYLGVDERIVELYDVDEVSIGDYVLTGGEPAALVMVDAITRLIPQVLGNFESALNDSFMNDILGTPCYTRPSAYEGHDVPAPLMSGNHVEIKKYRRLAAIRKCARMRPDLLRNAELTDEELEFVRQLLQSPDPNHVKNE